jgi:hypothetical protein
VEFACQYGAAPACRPKRQALFRSGAAGEQSGRTGIVGRHESRASDNREVSRVAPFIFAGARIHKIEQTRVRGPELAEGAHVPMWSTASREPRGASATRSPRRSDAGALGIGGAPSGPASGALRGLSGGLELDEIHGTVGVLRIYEFEGPRRGVSSITHKPAGNNDDVCRRRLGRPTKRCCVYPVNRGFGFGLGLGLGFTVTRAVAER